MHAVSTVPRPAPPRLQGMCCPVRRQYSIMFSCRALDVQPCAAVLTRLATAEQQCPCPHSAPGEHQPRRAPGHCARRYRLHRPRCAQRCACGTTCGVLLRPEQLMPLGWTHRDPRQLRGPSQGPLTPGPSLTALQHSAHQLRNDRVPRVAEHAYSTGCRRAKCEPGSVQPAPTCRLMLAGALAGATKAASRQGLAPCAGLGRPGSVGEVLPDVTRQGPAPDAAAAPVAPLQHWLAVLVYRCTHRQQVSTGE